METYREASVSRASGITFPKKQKCNITKFEKYKLDWENDTDVGCHLQDIASFQIPQQQKDIELATAIA